jgi:hypothetical protein
MEQTEDIVGTSRAAWLLKVTGPRVRQLIAEGRVEGAYKEGRFWRIPLYKGMPQIISGKRGPKGLWYRRKSEAASNIYVNKDQIRKNTLLKREEANRREPVIIVEQGKRKEYGYEVEINGPCRIVYSPDRALHGEDKTNPLVWIETYSEIKFADVSAEPHKCRLRYQQLPTAKKKPTRSG